MRDGDESARFFTSGQMAKLNGISKKTLRVYADRGLLTPRYTDPETGYRYYTLDQSAQLDAIAKLQAIGFSLQEIGDLLAQQDTRQLALRMNKQIDTLNQEMERLRLSLEGARRMQSSCAVVLSKPPCGKISVEWLPHRRFLFFNIEQYDYSEFRDIQRDGFFNWEMTLRLIKREMVRRGIPLSLFQRVGCLSSKCHLEAGRFVVTGAVIEIENDIHYPDCIYYDAPAGLYMCCYCGGEHKSSPFFQQEAEYYFMLLCEIRARGYVINGDYIGNVLADTPIFNYAARESFMRLEIPIRSPE